MGTTAEFHGEIGPGLVGKRMIDLARRLKKGLRDAGIPLVPPMEDALSAGIVIVEVPAESRREVFSAVGGGFAARISVAWSCSIGPPGTTRIGPLVATVRKPIRSREASAARPVIPLPAAPTHHLQRSHNVAARIS